MLASKRKKIKEAGKGNKKNRADALSVEDEKEMWESGALGEKMQKLYKIPCGLCYQKTLVFAAAMKPDSYVTEILKQRQITREIRT